MILVDSSVWIDHFNQVESSEAEVLHELILSDTAIGIVDVCLTEILQGFRREHDVDLVCTSLLSFNIVSMTSIEDHLSAAAIYRRARRQGVTIRSTIDCLVAAVCVREDALLLHKDRDYDRIASCCALRVLAA